MAKAKWNMENKSVKAVAITPSDTAVAEYDDVYVGGAGNLAVILRDDTTAVTFVGMRAGTKLGACVKKIMSTNTTATNIVGLTDVR